MPCHAMRCVCAQAEDKSDPEKAADAQLALDMYFLEASEREHAHAAAAAAAEHLPHMAGTATASVTFSARTPSSSAARSTR